MDLWLDSEMVQSFMLSRRLFCCRMTFYKAVLMLSDEIVLY